MNMDNLKEKSLDKIWKELGKKCITYRKEGDLYLTTVSDKSSVYYNTSRGNINIFFLNASCLSIYEIINRYNGNIRHVVELFSKNGISDENAYNKINNALNILNGNKEYISINSTVINYPYFAHIDITSKCNLKCQHCLNPTELYQNDDMTLDEWIRVIDKLAELGISIIWIGGGEPLIRKDVFDILKYIKSKNIRMVLATNGILLTEKFEVKELLDLIDEITICIDGSNQDIHGFFRRPKKYFDIILSNIRRIIPIAHDSGCLLKIFTCIAKHNLHDVSNIIDLSYKLKADSWACQAFVPMNRGENFSEQIITHRMRKYLSKIIKEKDEKYKHKIFLQPYIPLLTMEKVYQEPKMECSAGNAVLYIASNGNVFPCSRLIFDEFLIGNIRDINLIKEWNENNVFLTLRNINYSKTKCGKCDYFLDGKCNGGCKAEKYRRYRNIYDFYDPNCGYRNVQTQNEI
jgi:radical SAM protein with 4Fe4S-binding SPASM domain